MFLGAFWTTIAAVLGLLTVLAIVGDPDNHGGQAGPFDLAYLIFVLPIIAVAALHPHRRQLYRIGGEFRGRLLAISVVVGVPGLIYAVEQALLQRNSWPPTADPHHNAHWLTSGALIAGLVLVGIVASVVRRGWQLPAWIVAGASLIVGVASIVNPNAASSLGTAGGAVAVIAAFVFAFEVSRLSQDSQPEPHDGLMDGKELRG